MENNFSFTAYFVDQEFYSDDENKKGDYWKFLDLSTDEINNLGIYAPSLCRIICKISNPDLKQKMKEKFMSYIKDVGVVYISFESCFNTGLFSVDEAKKIIEQDSFCEELKLHIKDNKKYGFKYNTNKFISGCLIIDDYEMQKEQISKVLDIVKENEDLNINVISILENIRKCNKFEIFNYMINQYKDILPQTYKNYIKIFSDSNYLRNKALKIAKKNIKIDIDPKIKVGVEIETNHPYNLHINIGNQNDFWNSFFIDNDVTVPNGIEVTSVPFTDNVKDVAKLCTVLEMLTDIGYYYDTESENTAGQINLGLDYLDSTNAILNFYEIFGNVEELLFYISNGNGQLTRQQIYRNSRFKPISEIIGSRIFDEDLPRDDLIKMFNVEHYNKEKKINGLENKKNTLSLRGEDENNYRFEVRIPNGGNDRKIWIDNIRLYGRMMEVSKKIAEFSKKEFLTREDKRILGLKLDLEDSSLSLDNKLVILMDLLFKEDEYKKIYFDRFVNTMKKIKETKTTKYELPKYIKAEPLFDTVEFYQKYNSKIEEEPTVSYDPKENIYIENGRRQRL